MLARHSSHLILGGARSGKSRHSLHLARILNARIAFIATAQPGDADMAARIARHQAERPSSWLTVEEAFELPAACRRLTGRADLLLVDCLTLWVSNRLLRGDDDTAILRGADDLAAVMAARAASLLIVSNEVGAGVHPPTAAGLRFQDLLGLVNQRVAQAADRVTLMVAGIPLTVKNPSGKGTADTPESPHDQPLQAP